MGGKYGNCTDIHQENHTRSVYEELYDDIIDYSLTVEMSFDCAYLGIYQQMFSIKQLTCILGLF